MFWNVLFEANVKVTQNHEEATCFLSIPNYYIKQLFKTVCVNAGGFQF